MPKLWSTPIYRLQANSGKQVTVDVTTSLNAALKAKKAIRKVVIPFFKSRNVSKVVDFGAGALRHAFPLLKEGIQVCAVEFEKTFKGEVCAKKLVQASKDANFSALIWPDQFLADNRKFDAALLCYVLQVMPLESERKVALKQLANRIRNDGFLVYMSRYNQALPDDRYHRVEDGAYRYPDREMHSFYREFTTEETHEMFKKHGFQHIRSLGVRGTEQFFVYIKGRGTWI